MSLIKIACPNRIFSSLGIEAKLIENLLSLGSKMTNFTSINDLNTHNPRANGAERRSGRKPGARVTKSTLAFTYIRIMRSHKAQWHSGMKSRPPFWIWRVDGFRCYAHAQVSSS